MKIYVEQELAQIRYDICKQCEYFVNTNTKCTQCNRIMKEKVKYTNFACPIEKWEKVDGYA